MSNEKRPSIMELRKMAIAVMRADAEMKERGGRLPGDTTALAEAVLDFTNDLNLLEVWVKRILAGQLSFRSQLTPEMERLFNKWGFLP